MFVITKKILDERVQRINEMSFLRVDRLPENIRLSTQIVGLLHSIHKYLKNKTDDEIALIDEFTKEVAISFVNAKNNQGHINYSYLEWYEILEVMILDDYLAEMAAIYEKTTLYFENYELFAVLSLSYLLESCDMDKEISYEAIFRAFESVRVADKYYFLFLLKEKNIESLTFIDKLMSKKIKSINAQRAGRCKKSPYEKAGTSQAVNQLLQEKQELLNQRGGKAELNRMILDLIVNGDIPAPSTPSPKTVDLWIDRFKTTQSTR